MGDSKPGTFEHAEQAEYSDRLPESYRSRTATQAEEIFRSLELTGGTRVLLMRLRSEARNLGLVEIYSRQSSCNEKIADMQRPG